MKKLCLILLLLFFVSSFIFANTQKYYAVSSREWMEINNLCHIAGVAGPTSIGPVTGEMLLSALKRAEKILGDDNLYCIKVRERLEKDNLAFFDGVGLFDFIVEFNPEFYVDVNPSENRKVEYDGIIYPYKADEDWLLRDYNKRKDMFNIKIEAGLHDILYGSVERNFTRTKHDDGFFDSNFTTNFSSSLSQNFPYDGAFSLGTKNLSLMIGRGKVSQGEGKSGNTAVGDNFIYQEYLKGGFFSNNVAVFLTLTHFDSSFDIYGRGSNNPYFVNGARFSGNQTLRYHSDFEFTFFDKLKISFGLIELIDSSSSFDIRLLNPFTVLHGMFNYTEGNIVEANNMLTLDLSCSFLPKWNIYAQLTFDQIQTRGEVEGKSELDPFAFAFLFNLSYSDIIKDGILNSYFESVYTSPGMYLNEKYYNSNGKVVSNGVDENGNINRRCWTQDFLLSYAYYGGSVGADNAYSGYSLGPDTLLFTIGSDYTVLEGYYLKSTLIYFMHGEKGRGSNVLNYTFNGINSIDTYNRLALTGTIEHNLGLTLEGEWNIFKESLSLSGGLGFTYSWNYRNQVNINKADLKMYIALSFRGGISDIVEIFTKKDK